VDFSSVLKPAFTGLRVLKDYPCAELAQFIDWSPFFHTWELKGSYPKILKEPRAKELFEDAQKLLNAIVKDGLLRAHGVYGFWPANSMGDDIELYTDESRSQILTTFHTLRQQTRKAAGEPNYALADFVAPAGVRDYLGAFAVTAGHGLDELCARFEKDHDDYNSIMAKALADRLAEAFAERLHKQAREDLGVKEDLSSEDLIAERYRGIRPAPGYPAYPDHTEKRALFDLLQAEANAEIRLTESFAMIPASSVAGLYFSHPDSRYFTVGRIGRDQLEDYAGRKSMSRADLERVGVS
jgi:5-methyltetrahydrofolate--homocysteine methyltransferase